MGVLDTAREVRSGEELDVAALERLFAERAPELAGPVRVQQFPRGHSNLTYLLTVGDRDVVLRRPPRGAERIQSGHDMRREYTVLRGLHPVWPRVPRPLFHVAKEESPLGVELYVMERVPGVILRGPRVPPELGLDADGMRRLSESFVDVLVSLHAVDPREAGLAELGRPEGYVRRQVQGWRGRWERARTDDVPDMERIGAWLAAHLPPEAGAVLVHNDFKYDNLVLDPAAPTTVRAVLDWEMATLGDPLADLGMALAYWFEPAEADAVGAAALGPTTLPGNLSREALVERYARASGRPVEHVVFHYVLGTYKVAVIAQQIYARYRQGLTKDERFAGLGFAVQLLAHVGARAAERGRITGLLD